MKTKNIASSLILGFLLSSCTPNVQSSSTSLMESNSSLEESSLASSSELSVATSSSTSLEKSSESSNTPRERIFAFTVKIYQSYVTMDDYGRTGLRFDTSFKIEAGEPLYTTTEEMRKFYREMIHPEYSAHGGAYTIAYLYTNPQCTTYYQAGAPIMGNSTFYYYGSG